MTIQQSTPEAVVWVAIDISKDRHEVLIEAPGWRSRKKFRLQNTAEEFRSFAAFLHSLGFPVRIGFEPTGNYHRALAYFLHSEGFQLQLISSVALARTREAMHNSWDKNDPKDAQVILHLLKTGLTHGIESFHPWAGWHSFTHCPASSKATRFCLLKLPTGDPPFSKQDIMNDIRFST